MTLSIVDLTCTRGGRTVLSGVSLTLMPGQAIVLQGPNGSGKTTLLRTIAGLQPASGGQIVAAPDQIAYAAHADGIKPTLTVGENLAFWAAIFGQPSIADALGMMDLAALVDRPGLTLSAGQKRRLGIARLAVTGRLVWLLDEPTVSLDAGSVRLFVALMTRHLHQGGSALIATHIDLGLPQASVLDLAAFRPVAATGASDFDGVTA